MAKTSTRSRKWKDLHAGEKVAFVGKLMIFLITFGFAFPTLLND
jgi:hypothetical protein